MKANVKPDQIPSWLLNAATDGAQVHIGTDGTVTWLGGHWLGGTWEGDFWNDGEWHGGVWEGGLWRRGIWRDGTWMNGEWFTGTWHHGTWHKGNWWYGTWIDGNWMDGIWHAGLWRGGRWVDGWDNPSRCEYSVTSDGEGNISFDCHIKTREEWVEILEGRAECAAAPPRDSKAWKRLVAAFLAQCAYDDAMAEE